MKSLTTVFSTLVAVAALGAPALAQPKTERAAKRYAGSVASSCAPSELLRVDFVKDGKVATRVQLKGGEKKGNVRLDEGGYEVRVTRKIGADYKPHATFKKAIDTANWSVQVDCKK
jgi:hypothetical protein